MRLAAVAIALSLVSLPSFAKKTSKKGPQDGQYCAKNEVGTTAQDKKGNTLTCKADKQGKPRWTK